jgi:predicted CXXCH cytochrome family protein
MVGTNYDSSSNATEQQLCVYCHTPHKAEGVGGPIWNRQNGTAADGFTTYGNTQAGTTAKGIIGAQSLSCLSCHDGTISVDSIYNPPGDEAWVNDGDSIVDTSFAYIGTDLSDDHPVSIVYTEGVAGLKTLVNGDAGGMPLFNGDVECATCHDVHDDSLGSFLRVEAAQSAICSACHDQ